MPLTHSSIPAALREQVRQQPDAPAYTFIDYEVNPAGNSESLTWSQVHQRAQVVAAELASYGSPGDRAAILAPQGLEYIVGLLGAMEAGFIAVPLSVPLFGAHDERLSAALRNSSPVAILTTSAVINDVVSCARALPGPPPAVIEIDALDLDTPPAFPTNAPQTKTALLQYTSGSTRAPTGVVVTHQNIITNLEQMMSDTFEDRGKVPPPDTTVVSWLPFYHDLGLMCGIVLPVLTGLHVVLTSPMAFLEKPARWMQLVARNTRTYTGGPNFAYELAARRTSDEDMAGLDLGHVHTFAFGGERVHAATIRRFVERFSRFNLPDIALRPGYGLAEAVMYVTSCPPGRPPESRPVRLREALGRLCETVRRRRRCRAGQLRRTSGVHRAHRRSPDVPRESGRQGGGDLGARRQRRGRLLAKPAAVRADLRWAARRSGARHAAGALASDRRFGRHVRGRAVHRWPHQGSADRGWA